MTTPIPFESSLADHHNDTANVYTVKASVPTGAIKQVQEKLRKIGNHKRLVIVFIFSTNKAIIPAVQHKYNVDVHKVSIIHENAFNVDS